jgi:hypothetical protein
MQAEIVHRRGVGMPGFDAQFVIVFKDAGPSLEDWSGYLSRRALKSNKNSILQLTCPSITVNTTILSQAIRQVADKSRVIRACDHIRIYLVGHGDFNNMKISHWNPTDVVAMIKACAFSPHAIKLVNLCSCRLARETTLINDNLEISTTSFAGEFHKSLKAAGIKTRVHAYTDCIMVDAGGFKWSVDDLFVDEQTGYINTDTDVAQDIPHSVKLMFTWKGDEQSIDRKKS